MIKLNCVLKHLFLPNGEYSPQHLYLFHDFWTRFLPILSKNNVTYIIEYICFIRRHRAIAANEEKRFLSIILFTCEHACSKSFSEPMDTVNDLFLWIAACQKTPTSTNRNYSTNNQTILEWGVGRQRVTCAWLNSKTTTQKRKSSLLEIKAPLSIISLDAYNIGGFFATIIKHLATHDAQVGSNCKK